MSEISTRVWLDEHVWIEVTNRAVIEGMTVRELIPRLVQQSLPVALTSAGQGEPYSDPQTPAAATLTESVDTTSGLPVVTLSDVYRCGICGAEVRLGGLSNHIGKHKKEREAAEAEGS